MMGRPAALGAANGKLLPERNVSAVRTQFDEVLPSVPTFRRHPNASLLL